MSCLRDTPTYRDHVRVKDVHESREAYSELGPCLLEHLLRGLVPFASKIEHVFPERCSRHSEPPQSRVRSLVGHVLRKTCYGGAGGESLEASPVAAAAAWSCWIDGHVSQLPTCPLGASQEDSVGSEYYSPEYIR